MSVMIDSLAIARAPADAEPRQIRELFDAYGYIVLEGVLAEHDLAPVRTECEEVLDRLSHEWHRNGELSSPFADLEFALRLIAVVRETGVRYNDYLNIKIPPNIESEEAPIHTGPEVFKLLVDKRLLAAVEHFIGPEIYSSPVQNVRFKVPERCLRQLRLIVIKPRRVPWSM